MSLPTRPTPSRYGASVDRIRHGRQREHRCDRCGGYAGTGTRHGGAYNDERCQANLPWQRDSDAQSSDAESGVAFAKWSLDGGAWTTGTTVNTSALGTHILEFYSVDAAGNVEQTHSVSFDVMNRYDDTDELITWSGAWGSASITGVYDGSIHYAMSSPASATFAFHGTGFDLISFMSSKYGLAQVSIDGGPAIDVDMYRASATLSDVSYSVRELADTTHTVEVWRISAITSGTAANVSIDAIDVVGTLVNDAEAPTINRYDDTDELIAWTGAWGSASITGVYDGSIHYAMSSPASATFAFHGTGFDLISFMSSKYGLAQVSIDGGPAIDVDMYRASATLSDVSYSVRELADTTHTVEVWRVGEIASGTAANVSIDAIDVVGTLVLARDTAAPTTTSDVKPTYPGSATVTLSPSDAESGVAFTKWSLDGGAWTTGTTVNTSALGTHILEFYSVDAAGNVEQTHSVSFDVMNRYDDTDELITWSGAWGSASITGVYDGSIHYAMSSPASATFAFHGTGFDLISFMSSKYGLAQVSIDGGPAIDVDMYRASATLSDVSYSVRELADTTHTVEVWRVGEIASGTAANVSIDAIDVVGTLVNDISN